MVGQKKRGRQSVVAQKQAMSFRKFKEFPGELRAMIWRQALPDYGTYVVSSVFTAKDAPGTIISLDSSPPPMPQDLVWGLKDLPRDKWAYHNRRTKKMRAMLRTCQESRREAILRFPVVIGRDRRMRFHPEFDVLMINQFEFAWDDFLERIASITFAASWNTKITKLAIHGIRLEKVLAYLFQENTFDMRFVMTHARSWRYAAGFLQFLRQLPQLQKVFLVEYYPIDQNTWLPFFDDTKQQFMTKDFADNAFYTGISRSPLTTEKCQSQWTWTPEVQGWVPVQYKLNPGELTQAVDNVIRVIYGNPTSSDNQPFAENIEFLGLKPDLKNIHFHKLYVVQGSLGSLGWPLKPLFQPKQLL